MKKVLLFIFISLLAMAVYAKPSGATVEDLPKQSIVIGYSMPNSQSTVYHIVDLSSKELIAVCYDNNGGIRYIIHTGIIIDLEKQHEIKIEK